MLNFYDTLKSVNFDEKSLITEEEGLELDMTVDLKVISRCIPHFKPINRQPSEIMHAGMIQVLTHYLPMHLKYLEWTLGFSINRDGYSPVTFFENLKEFDQTLVVVKDTNGYVFGGYCTEPWKRSNAFYGGGDSFMFTFQRDRDL